MKRILPESDSRRTVLMLSILGVVSFGLLMAFHLGVTELFFFKAAPKTLQEVGKACLWLIGLDALCIGLVTLARELMRRHHRKDWEHDTR